MNIVWINSIKLNFRQNWLVYFILGIIGIGGAWLTALIYPGEEGVQGLLVMADTPFGELFFSAIIDNLDTEDGAFFLWFIFLFFISYAANVYPLLGVWLGSAGTPEEALHLGDNRGHAPGEIHGHIIGNYMQLGPESPKVDESHILIRDPEGRYYIHDNLDVDVNDRILDLPIDGRTERIERAPVFWASGVPLMSAQQAKEYVLKNAGMFPEERDATDKYIIDMVRGKRGGLVTSPSLRSMGVPRYYINRYYN